MKCSSQRSLLPLVGLQGAVGSIGGFIGFFITGTQDLHAIFRYTACMLTAAMATIFLTYFFGPRFHLNGRWLLPGREPVLRAVGRSALVPALYIGYSVLRAAGLPFLGASQQVLTQRVLDIHGELSDRILARELVLWMLRMVSLCVFWALANVISPMSLLVAGSTLLAAATAMQYVIGKDLFWNRRTAGEQAV